MLTDKTLYRCRVKGVLWSKSKAYKSRPQPLSCFPIFEFNTVSWSLTQGIVLFLKHIFPSLLISWSFEDIYSSGREKPLPKASSWQLASHWSFTRGKHVLFPSVLIRHMIALLTSAITIFFALCIKTQPRRKMCTFHLDLTLAKSCAIFAFSRFLVLSLSFGATVCLVNNLTVFCC